MILLATNSYSIFIVLAIMAITAIMIWTHFRQKSRRAKNDYRQLQQMYRFAAKGSDITNMTTFGTAAIKNQHVTFQFVQEIYLDIRDKMTTFPQLYNLKDEISTRMDVWFVTWDWPQLEKKIEWGKFDDDNTQFQDDMR